MRASRQRAIALLLAVAAVGAACSNLTGPEDQASEANPDDTAGSVGPAGLLIEADFEPGECPFEIPEGSEPRCGTVSVPSDWSAGGSDESSADTITLPVAVFASSGKSPAADPVIYLEGGPGGHALETLRFSYTDLVAPLQLDRDVIVFDQRGAGYATPRLDCPESTEATRTYEDTPRLSDEESDALFHRALADCRARLIDDGIDLTDYNSINNAHDVEAIRVALGYDQWNLFGISYGTKLGLEVLRQHPEAVRAVVLDSVYPPQVDSVRENPATFSESLARVVAACAAEPACAADGDLGQRLASLAQQLQASPKRVEVEDWLTGESDEIYLNGDTFVGVVSQSLYSSNWFSDLPELAADLEAGRTVVAEEFLSQLRTTESFFTEGMFYAIACNEEIAFADPAEVIDPPDPFGLRDTFELASNTGTNAFGTCAAFENGKAPASANEAVTSDVPTLLMAGRFDPVTPVEWAEQAAVSLSESKVVVSEVQSHGVSSTECGIGIVSSFLLDPSGSLRNESLDTCLAEERVWFVGGGDEPVELEPATYPVSSAGGEADLVINTVRPADWSVGSLSGDQYRQASFLDPTQLFQLMGSTDLGGTLADFITDQTGVSFTSAAVFEGSASPGLQAGDLDRRWRRRVGRADDVAVEWFETDAGEGNLLYVILVSTTEELDANLDHVVAPALAEITVGEGE